MSLIDRFFHMIEAEPSGPEILLSVPPAPVATLTKETPMKREDAEQITLIFNDLYAQLSAISSKLDALFAQVQTHDVSFDASAVTGYAPAASSTADAAISTSSTADATSSTAAPFTA